MDNFYFNDMIRNISIKGIHMIMNTENKNVIGLSEDGLNFCTHLKENICTENETEQNMELFDSLKELDFISNQPYDIQRHHKIETLSAYVHITNLCNLSCLGCYSFDDKRNKSCDPNTEQLKTCFKHLADAGVKTIVISGGEPLLRKDLNEILKYAKTDLHMQDISLITNGTVDYSFEDLKPYIDEITVSVDGYDEEHPTYIRNPGIFRKIINTVDKIKNSGIAVSILPTLHSKNYDKVPEYISLSNQLNVPLNFSILSVCDTPVLKEFIPDDNQLKVLSESLLNTDIPINDVGIGSDLEAGLNCGAGRTVLSIATNGDIYPCHMLHFQEFKIGNIFESPLSLAHLNKDVIETLGRANADTIDECKFCDYRYFCSGGCRARAYYQFHDIMKKDSYCELSRYFYDKITDDLVHDIEEMRKKEVSYCG